MKATKTTISYPQPLEETVQDLMDAGVIDNRSAFFQRAAIHYLMSLDSATGVVAGAVKNAEYEREDMVREVERIEEAVKPNQREPTDSSGNIDL